MSSLLELIDHLSGLVDASPAALPTVQQAVSDLIQQAANAGQQDAEVALQHMSALVSQAGFLPAALIAVGCGALIERGADPAIASAAILTRIRESLELAPTFVSACQNEARDHPGVCDPADSAACVQQFGRKISQQMPEVTQAWAALEPFCTAALAVLMRLPAMRETVRNDRAFQGALAAYPLDSSALQCVRDILQVLENEEIIVLHPVLKRGYRVCIRGIGRNFELHTLLADALIGDPAQGWLPGQRPDPRVVSAAKDGPFPWPGEDAKDFPSAVGKFNLWNWQGLQPDGTLPQGFEKKEHWIWNEGKPADIAMFEGVRVILLGPPPYERRWNAGRYFPGMKGEVEVLEHLSPVLVDEWLTRIQAAVTH